GAAGSEPRPYRKTRARIPASGPARWEPSRNSGHSAAADLPPILGFRSSPIRAGRRLEARPLSDWFHKDRVTDQRDRPRSALYRSQVRWTEPTDRHNK